MKRFSLVCLIFLALLVSGCGSIVYMAGPGDPTNSGWQEGVVINPTDLDVWFIPGNFKMLMGVRDSTGWVRQWTWCRALEMPPHTRSDGLDIRASQPDIIKLAANEGEDLPVTTLPQAWPDKLHVGEVVLLTYPSGPEVPHKYRVVFFCRNRKVDNSYQIIINAWENDVDGGLHDWAIITNERCW